MNWLILGASGQLGKSVEDELNEIGLKFNSPTKLELDITSESMVRNYLESTRPDVIVNCAAWTNVDAAEANEKRAIQVNGYAVGSISKFAKKYESKFIQVSTDYVFSGFGKVPWSEEDTPAPKTVYGKSKHLGELEVIKHYPDNAYIIRTAWLYSKYGRNFVKSILGKIYEGSDTIPVVGDQFGQPTLASDLAKQIVEMITIGVPPGIYHGTNSGVASWFELAVEINNSVESSATRIVEIDSTRLQRPAPRPNYSVLSHDKWAGTKVAEMRDWKIALNESIGGIIDCVKEERK